MNVSERLRFVTFLTLVRFPLVLIFFATALFNVVRETQSLFTIALASLITAALTDLVDGYFARRLNVQTKFGAHADPLMDKFFYLGTLPLLVFAASHNGHVIHAVFLLLLTLFFLMRDQWVTFLRSIGSLYHVSGKASWSGKLRTCVNFPLICAIYHFEESDSFLPAWLIYGAESAAFIINLATLITYTRRYWPSLRKAADVGQSHGGDTHPEDVGLQKRKLDSLSLMARGISHDMNNILSAILGNAGIIMNSSPEDAPCRACAAQIESAAMKGVELTADLSWFTGRSQGSAEEIDMSALIGRMKPQLEPLIPRGIAVEYHLAGDLPVFMGEPCLVRKAVANLAANAADAMPDNTGVLRISTGTVQCDDSYLGDAWLGDLFKRGRAVFLELSDNGYGIDPEVRTLMFDPFFTTRLRGRGLGLSIVLGIMRAHKGAIKVQSASGKGAVFRLLFPAV